MFKLITLLAAVLIPLTYIVFLNGKPPRLEKHFIWTGLAAGLLAGAAILSFKTLFLQKTILPPSTETLTITLFVSFIEAGLLEEFFKTLAYFGTVLYLKNYFKNELLPFEFFAIGALVGLGFGIFENGYYAISPEFGKLNIVLDRIYTAILAHITFNATFGFLRSKKANIVFAFFCSVILHTVYDFFALPSTLLGGMLVRIFLVCSITLCIWMGTETWKRSTKEISSVY